MGLYDIEDTGPDLEYQKQVDDEALRYHWIMERSEFLQDILRDHADVTLCCGPEMDAIATQELDQIEDRFHLENV